MKEMRVEVDHYQKLSADTDCSSKIVNKYIFIHMFVAGGWEDHCRPSSAISLNIDTGLHSLVIHGQECYIILNKIKLLPNIMAQIMGNKTY
jgi:hypothetical protein